MIWFKYGTIVHKVEKERKAVCSQLKAFLLTFRIRNTFQYSDTPNHSRGKKA